MRGKCSAVIHLVRNSHDIVKETEHTHGPNVWNCYKHVVAELPQTTNLVEGLIILQEDPICPYLHSQKKYKIKQLKSISKCRTLRLVVLLRRRSGSSKTQTAMKRFVDRYAKFKEHGEELDYLCALGYAICLENSMYKQT